MIENKSQELFDKSKKKLNLLVKYDENQVNIAINNFSKNYSSLLDSFQCS